MTRPFIIQTLAILTLCACSNLNDQDKIKQSVEKRIQQWILDNSENPES